jgi:hypothetical protein
MPKRSAKTLGQVRPVHPHAWLWEPLESDPTFVLRSVFGAKAAYLGGTLMLCFCATTEPWRGVLVCTDHARHAALLADFPELVEHPILSKWLYLSESADRFERVAARLVELARRRDSRIGITSHPKRRRVAVGPGRQSPP